MSLFSERWRTRTEWIPLSWQYFGMQSMLLQVAEEKARQPEKSVLLREAKA
jgi:hypothetical protein